MNVETGSQIRGLAKSAAENYIVAGCTDGLITVFDLGQTGKERLTKELVSFMGKEGVRLVAWREKPRKEIITADETGVVTVWDLKSQSPIYVLQAHSGPVTQLEWQEEKQQLITCSKDKSIKVWKFPPIWVDEQSVVKRKVPDHEKEVNKGNDDYDDSPRSLDAESPAEPGMPSWSKKTSNPG